MTPKQLHANRTRIGQQIVAMRELRGLTQKEVAEAAGLKQPHIARAEGGQYDIRLDTLTLIAMALGCEIEIAPK